MYSGCFGPAYNSRNVHDRVALTVFLSVGGVRRLQEMEADRTARLLKSDTRGTGGLRLADRVREFVVQRMPQGQSASGVGG